MKYRGLVLGYYHQRNAGDDRLAECISGWLDDHELTFMSHTQRPAREVLERVDYVLLGGGSIATAAWGAFDRIAYWAAAARVSVFSAGITCSTYPEVRKSLADIPKTGGEIWVRDPQSARFLGEAFPVTQAPDLSWLFPMAFPEVPRDDRIVLNLRPPIKEGPDVEAWRNILAGQQEPLRPWSLCFGKDADAPELRRVAGLDDPMSFFDPTIAARSRAVVAMRFHAVLFAIQSGTPVVPIANARKLDEFCEPLGIPQMPVVDPGEPLEDWVSRAEAQQPVERLHQITSEASAAAWETASLFREQIEHAADRTRRRRRGLGYRLGSRWRRMCSGGG